MGLDRMFNHTTTLPFDYTSPFDQPSIHTPPLSSTGAQSCTAEILFGTPPPWLRRIPMPNQRGGGGGVRSSVGGRPERTHFLARAVAAVFSDSIVILCRINKKIH